MPLSKQEQDALAAAFANTTPGPWVSFVEGRDHEAGSSFIRTGAEDIELSGGSSADQDFIAMAHSLMPKLLDLDGSAVAPAVRRAPRPLRKP